MPVSRYHLRSEYSLADPELYRAADRDDPEAILEGVAMAGMVGVLRLLGDLAEFAAEIFHELHEEVMATAARSHNLMIRVQQVEEEFPSVEKAFISQTSHSHFNESSGIEWHAKLPMDQNLITQGDLPRFIMDSYEECRGPPRLFLLDKFDVAGAGACLKRYSDPSFFRTVLPLTRTEKVKLQRERKLRKVKKREKSLKNGDAMEIFSTSHFNARLHKLASDEKNTHVMCGGSLKRGHLSSASLNLRNGKGYMDHIFLMSPFQKAASDKSIHASNTKIVLNGYGESGIKMGEVHQRVSINESVKNEKLPYLSPEVEDLKLAADKLPRDISKGSDFKSFPERISNFERKNQENKEDSSESKQQSSVDGCRSGGSRTNELPFTCSDENYTTAGSYIKPRVDSHVYWPDEFETAKIPATILQKGNRDELSDAEHKQAVDTESYLSDEFQVEKTTTSSNVVYQKDLPVDGESKSKAIAHGLTLDGLDVKGMPSTFYVLEEKKNPLVDIRSKQDSTFDNDKSEKFAAIFPKLNQKDTFIGDESKIDDNGIGYIPIKLKVEKKPPSVNNYGRFQSINDCKPDKFEVEKLVPTNDYMGCKGSSVNQEIMRKVAADGFVSDDAASEVENYMDALTNMESEMETDTEIRAKHGLSVLNIISHEVNSDANEEMQMRDQYSDTHSVGGSSTTLSSNYSFKKNRSSYSSDSLGNLPGFQSLQGTEDMYQNVEISHRFKDVSLGPIPDNSSSKSSEKSARPGYCGEETGRNLTSKVFPSDDHDTSSELMDTPRNLETMSLECAAPIRAGNESADESSSTYQLATEDPSEMPFTFVKHSAEGINEHSEIYAGKGFAGEINDPSEQTLLNSPDISDMHGVIKDDHCSTEFLVKDEIPEFSSDCLTEIHGPSTQTTPDLFSGQMEDSMLSAENLMNRMLDSHVSVTESLEKEPCMSSEQYCLDGESLPEHSHVSPRKSSHDTLVGYSVLGVEADITSYSENLEVDDRVRKKNGLTIHKQAKSNFCILPLQSGQSFSGEPYNCDVSDLDQVPHQSSGIEVLLPGKFEGSSNLMKLEENEKTLSEGNCTTSLTEKGNSFQEFDFPSASIISNADENHKQMDDLGCFLEAYDIDDSSKSIAFPLSTSKNVNHPSSHNDAQLASECFIVRPKGYSLEPKYSQDGSTDCIPFQEEYCSQSTSNCFESEIIKLENHEHRIDSDEKLHATSYFENDEPLIESTVPDSSIGYDQPHDLKERQMQLQLMNDDDAKGHALVSAQDYSESRSRIGSQPSIFKYQFKSSLDGDEIDTSPLEEGIRSEVTNHNIVPSLNLEGDYCESDVLVQKMEIDPKHAGFDTSSTHEKQKESSVVSDSVNEMNLSSSALTICTSSDNAYISLQPAFSDENSEFPPFSRPVSNVTSLPTVPNLTIHSLEEANQASVDDSSRNSRMTLASSCSSVLPMSTAAVPSLHIYSYESEHQETIESELVQSARSSFPVSVASSANLDETPPLPPLPPLQWRMGKARQISPALWGEVVPSLESFSMKNEEFLHGHLHQERSIPLTVNSPAPLPRSENEKPLSGYQSSEQEMTLYSNSVVHIPTAGVEKPSPSVVGKSGQLSDLSSVGSVAKDEFHQQDEVLTSGGVVLPPEDPFPHPRTIESEKPNVKPYLELKQLKDPLVAGDERTSPASLGLMPQHPSSSTTHLVSDCGNSQHLFPISEGFIKLPLNSSPPLHSVEDGKPMDDHIGLSQEKDPLIEAIASHDRSLLRKTSERIPPAVKPKSDERNSLLEQIRSKSFNLKPTAATRPIVQGPNTNLNVVAILEKANAIRQAFAGSDEDDNSDSWSDS